MGAQGDTMPGVNHSFWDESLLRGKPLAIEPEIMQVSTTLPHDSGCAAHIDGPLCAAVAGRRDHGARDERHVLGPVLEL